MNECLIDSFGWFCKINRVSMLVWNRNSIKNGVRFPRRTEYHSFKFFFQPILISLLKHFVKYSYWPVWPLSCLCPSKAVLEVRWIENSSVTIIRANIYIIITLAREQLDSMYLCQKVNKLKEWHTSISTIDVELKVKHSKRAKIRSVFVR